jgi:catechol 2,3-dioxygenase-like lactoylglutathione lyase family enzyme
MADAFVRSISAITLATHDMARAVAFYTAIGFRQLYGGPEAPFTSFAAGPNYLNLILQPQDRTWTWWGRAIFEVSDVDVFYAQLLRIGVSPAAPPRDADWAERFFHLVDPDGHEISFMTPLPGINQLPLS